MEAVLSILKVYNIVGVGAITVGDVKSGTLRTGMKLNVNGKIMSVKTIQLKRQQIQEAHEGDNVGLVLSGGDYKTLKSITGQDVTFYHSATPMFEEIEKQEPIHPKGVLESLTDLFRKR